MYSEKYYMVKKYMFSTYHHKLLWKNLNIEDLQIVKKKYATYTVIETYEHMQLSSAMI